MTSKTCVICNVKQNGTFLCLIFDIELLFLTKFELTLLTFVISHHVSKCIIPKRTIQQQRIMIIQHGSNSCEAQYFIDSELEGKY